MQERARQPVGFWLPCPCLVWGESKGQGKRGFWVPHRQASPATLRPCSPAPEGPAHPAKL